MDAKLTITISNVEPVELVDLAEGMLGIAAEYSTFLRANSVDSPPDDVRLYVKEIRSGSIVTELVALAPFALALVEHKDTIVEYAKHLKTLYEFFAGKSTVAPAVIEKSTLQNLSTILEPIAKDRASQLNVAAMNFTGPVTFNLSSTEANAAQNAIRRRIDAMKEQTSGTHEQVAMYWTQARNEPNSKAGDKVRIESIYDGPVKVRFANDELKSRILLDEPFPFSKAHIVDVSVETVDGRPILYKVLRLHDTIDRAD